jgi:hypothetical protein
MRGSIAQGVGDFKFMMIKNYKMRGQAEFRLNPEDRVDFRLPPS